MSVAGYVAEALAAEKGLLPWGHNRVSEYLTNMPAHTTPELFNLLDDAPTDCANAVYAAGVLWCDRHLTVPSVRQLRRMITTVEQRTALMLEGGWTSVERLVKVLCKRRRLSGKQVAKIITGCGSVATLWPATSTS